MNRIKQLRKQAGLSQIALGQLLHVDQTAISQWETGKTNPSTDTAVQVARIFNVSIDFLLGSDNPKETPALTKKDERDIAKDLESMMGEMENSESLMFDGQPMTDEAKESILAAMKLGLEAAKAKNKARFTPKKYRKD